MARWRTQPVYRANFQEMTARELIDAIGSEDARVEHTGGNVATVFWSGDTLAIGPGTFNRTDPMSSRFTIDFNLFVGRADGTGGSYIIHAPTPAMVRNAARQAEYDNAKGGE